MTDKELGYSLKEVNVVKDPNNLTIMEKKHLPAITVPDKVKTKELFEIKIKIGGIDGVEHPNLLGYWINWVDVYAGDRFLGRFEFAPETTKPEITIHIALDETTTLRIFGFCNLHGIWKSTKEITIE